MDCSPPSSSLCEISQARILEWVAISSFRESSQPRDQTCNSCFGRLVHTQVNTHVKYEFGCCFFDKLRIMKIDFENLEILRKYIYSLFYVRIENTQNDIEYRNKWKNLEQITLFLQSLIRKLKPQIFFFPPKIPANMAIWTPDSKPLWSKGWACLMLIQLTQ